MAVIGTAYIDVRPDTHHFGSAAVRRDVSGRMGGIARAAAGAFVTGFAVVQGVQFFKGIIADAEESRRVMRESAQVIESTGGIANVTAKDVDRLADSISRKTGIDDEAIASSANMLLTFTNVRNEAGKGNDVFDQSVGLVQDLSVAFKTDASGAAKTLGKALNDPIAGISALTRVGVQFTDQQKEQIKSMVESGDIMGAQKLILAELTTQVGGQAEAQSTASARMAVAWGNIREELGTRLLPIVDKVAGFLADKLPGALDATGRALAPVAEAVGMFFRALTSGFTEDEGTGIERFALKVREFALFLVNDAWPAIQRVVEAVGGWKDVLIVAAVAVAAIVSPIGTLVAAVIYAYTHFEGFRTAVDAVVQWFMNTALPAIQRAAQSIVESFGELVTWVQQHWTEIQEAIDHVIVAVQFAIETWVDYILMLWDTFGDELLNIAELVWDQIATIVETVIGVVRGIIETVMALINGDWGKAWDAIKGIFSTVWDGMRDYLGNALQIVGQLLEGALSGLRQLWDIAWDAIKGVLVAVWDAIVDAVRTQIGNVVDFFTALPGRLVGAIGDLVGMLRAKAVEWIGGMLAGLVEKIVDVIDWFGALPGRLIGQLPNPLNLLLEVGKDVIRGLINGIEALKDKLFAVVRAIGGFIKDQFERALEVGSPSQVTFEIGRNVMLGLIAGMQSEQSTLQSTIEGIADITREGLGADKLFGQFGRNADVTFDEIVAGLQEEAEAITRFEAAFSTLQRRGLNADLLEQLRFAGPQAAQFAEQLAAGSINQINALLSQIDRRGLNLRELLIPEGMATDVGRWTQAEEENRRNLAALEAARIAEEAALHAQAVALWNAAEAANAEAAALAEFTRTTQDAIAQFGSFGENFGDVQRWMAAEAANAVEEFRRATQEAAALYGPFGQNYNEATKAAAWAKGVSAGGRMGGGSLVTIAAGAVQVIATSENRAMVQSVVDAAFDKLVAQLRQR